MARTWGVAALAAALLVVAPRARAEGPGGDDFKTHVHQAKVHYDLGEFEQAAEEYIEAYRIKPVAGALFNIAQAYRQAGNYDKSRQFYRSFLREAHPDAKMRANVEKQIRELNELIVREEKTKQSPPTGVEPSLVPSGGDDLSPSPATARTEPASVTPAITDADLAPSPAPAAKRAPPAPLAPAIAPERPPERLAVAETHSRPAPAPAAAVRPVASVEASAPSGKSHTLAYVTGGAAVLILGGGAFFGVQAARADNELTAGAHDRADADNLISTSKSDHTLSAVLLAAGAAAAVGAGLLYFLPTSGPSGGAGGAVGGRF